MADSEFWRGLINWATALSETASLHWNKAHTAVELGDVSYQMRQNLESLSGRAGHLHLLAEVYVYFRGKAVDALAKGETPRFFHPLPYRRTAYRGSVQMESRSMDGYIQPLRDALREYSHEREAAENPEKSSKTGPKEANASDLAVHPKSPGDRQDDVRTTSGMSAAMEVSEQPEAEAVASPDVRVEQSPAGESVQRPQSPEAQGPKESRKAKTPVRRSEKYVWIDRALCEFAAARPKNHKEVFRLLEDRKVAIPNRRPFKTVGGWFKGFQQDPHSASAWLSQAWGRLNLPSFPRGPKK
jgi:hypothetical protein